MGIMTPDRHPIFRVGHGLSNQSSLIDCIWQQAGGGHDRKDGRTPSASGVKWLALIAGLAGLLVALFLIVL